VGLEVGQWQWFSNRKDARKKGAPGTERIIAQKMHGRYRHLHNVIDHQSKVTLGKRKG
jgi:hypothetical protein